MMRQRLSTKICILSLALPLLSISSCTSVPGAMAPVAGGQGIPNAAAYNPDEPGPHRLVLLTESGSPLKWNKSLPADVFPSSINATELVVILGPEHKAALDSAGYSKTGLPEVGGGTTVTRYRFEMDVEIREARSRRTLESGIVRGTEPESFPMVLPAGQTSIVGEQITYRDLEGWLMCYMNICRTLEGDAPVSDVAFSPDGQSLTSASPVGFRLWRVSDGALLHTLVSTSLLSGVDFSPDGQTLASESWGTTVSLWRASDGTLLRTMEGDGHVYDLAFSPDGQTLASGSDGNTVHLWRVSDGALLRTLVDTDGVYSVAFSPDGQTLASGSWGTTVSLWQVSDGTLLRTMEEDSAVSDLAFSPDGQTLASGSWGKVSLWRVSDGTLLRTMEADTHSYVFDLSFSPDGRALVARSDGNTVRLWRVSNGALLRSFVHTSPVSGVSFSPDGQTLASVSRGTTLCLWRLP
jgi:hypothetical protein